MLTKINVLTSRAMNAHRGAQAAASPTDPEAERIRSIILAPEAKGHEAQAIKYATETDMSVDAARAALAAIPAALAIPSVAERSSPLLPIGGGMATQSTDYSQMWGQSMGRAATRLGLGEA